MRVRVIRRKSDERPSSIATRLPEGQISISTGIEYEIHAIAVFQGGVSLQLVDDLAMINWYPAWFFEVCEPTVPKDWVCSLMTGDLQMVLGPGFVAGDEASYNRMVELEADSVARFWQRLDAKSPTEG